LVVAAVPCVAIWLGARRLALRIAFGISGKFAPRPADAHPTGSNVLAGIFEIAIIFGAVTLLLAIIGPFMSVFDGLTVMLIAMGALAIVIWRSASHLYAMVHEASVALVERMDSLHEIPPASASTGDAGHGPGGIGPMTPVRILEGSGAIGRSLSDLNLHATTGAMVMAIARNGSNVILPGGSEVLRAGDTIVIAGPTDAISAAKGLLAEPSKTESAPQPVIQ